MSERYIAKSDPFIVMISTPYAPQGLFEKIEYEPEETCICKRIFLDYTYGLDKIYTKEEIDKAKQSPHSMGIDPGWGSSPFGIVTTQWTDGQIQVLYAEEFERPDFNEMLFKVSTLMTEYKFTKRNCKIYVDGANPSVIKSLKLQLGENPDYDKAITRYKSQGWDWTRAMTVIPVNFSTEHKAMFGHAKMLFERGQVSINKKYDKLITSLRTAAENEGILDKETTQYDDIFDAFRLALRF
jgi:hypothetical protein